MNKNIKIERLCQSKALNHMRNSNITGAVEELKACLVMNPQNVETLNMLGFCYYILCNFDSARELWLESIGIEDKDNQAHSYMEMIELEEFLAIRESFESAKKYFEQSDYKNAAFKAMGLIDKKPELVMPYIIAGISLIKLGDNETGSGYIQTAISKDSENEELKKYSQMYMKSAIKTGHDFKLLSKKNAAIAISICMVTLAIAAMLGQAHPQSVSQNGEAASVSKLAKIKQEHFKNEENAQETSQQKQSSSVDNDNTPQNADAEASSSKLDGKIEDEQGIYIASAEKFKAENYSEAAAGFEKIALGGEQERFVSESIFFAAQSYERLKEFDKAIKYYGMYVEFFKEGHYSDDSLYSLGLIYYAQGDQDKSQSTLKRLKREYPDSMFINSKVEDIILQE
ncbi:tetratricopeptide repeat protein [Peptoclostridium acidaminophilum DSM 3953]|uniref:Tetratricopeptide repeat protein n=1 Tax=Peptoclostridium acidaminophilum DSM 3953 TaxID=1286171 RepID=W8TCA5_PEPAC|nr:tetratricopeptide repeat protein [Peptoclostridium acidaminophilum]AHM55438.1 tetratricopeptide repeat protein [Peptoclostridium acidaminophilum DSM 3953]